MKGITMWEMSVTYNQEPDGMDDANDPQSITMTLVDGGAGTYIAIETKRWAFDNADELKKLIDDFVTKTKTGIKGDEEQ